MITLRDERQLRKESFDNWLRDACKVAVVPGSALPLGKPAATMVVKNGVTELELNAIFGWMSSKIGVFHKDGEPSAVRAAGLLASWRKNMKSSPVIPPFLVGWISRIYAALFSFWAGVMPPMPMLGRSLLYVQSHCVA